MQDEDKGNIITLEGQRLGIQWILTTRMKDLHFTDDLTLMSHTLPDTAKEGGQVSHDITEGWAEHQHKTMRVNKKVRT